MKKREVLPDILRGFAIIMVVLGHCIQEGNGADFSLNQLYFNDRLYWFIYSFHMPLFALIAGYFAYYSIRKADTPKERLKLLGKRAITYLIPIFFWTLFEAIREAIVYSKLGAVQYTPLSFIAGFLKKVAVNHWFLWAMLLFFFFIWIMHYYLKDNIYIHALIYLLLFVIPDAYNLHVYKFLLPFYVAGFYYAMGVCGEGRKYSNSFSQKLLLFFQNKKYLLFAISCLAFAGLFLLFRDQALIYVSGYRFRSNFIWQMVVIDIYRMVIGFIGSVFWISLFSVIKDIFKAYTFPVLTAFGKNSLGVYLISGYLILLVMKDYTDPLFYSIPRVLIETVIVSVISLVVSILLGKIPVVKKLIGK